jgi:hydrogenase nickel incorporation protein HypB
MAGYWPPGFSHENLTGVITFGNQRQTSLVDAVEVGAKRPKATKTIRTLYLLRRLCQMFALISESIGGDTRGKVPGKQLWKTSDHYGAVHKTRDLAMGTDVLAENRRLASENLERLRSRGIRSVDIMGSIGSGKTALIERLAVRLREEGIRAAAIAGDVTGQDDYGRFLSVGLPSVNVNTGKECHLDAHLIDHALDELDLDSIDFLFIENVGNLVCPADFPLGTDKRIVVISVTEGDDMIRKHPMIFTGSDVAVLNKIDLLPYLDVDVERLKQDYRKIRSDATLHLISAKTGEGISKLLSLLGIHA